MFFPSKFFFLTEGFLEDFFFLEYVGHIINYSKLKLNFIWLIQAIKNLMLFVGNDLSTFELPYYASVYCMLL